MGDTELRAAAPDLLAALENCVEVIDSDQMKAAWATLYAHGIQWTGKGVDMVAARAAIAKARGQRNG